MQTVGIIFVAVFLAAVIGIRQLGKRKPEAEDLKDETTEIAELDPQTEPEPEPTPRVEPERDTDLKDEVPEEIVKEKERLNPPLDVTATDGDEIEEVRITWSKVENAEKYIVYRADFEQGNYSKIGETLHTAYNDNRVKPNKDYFYKVQAWSASTGAGEFSLPDGGNSSKIKLFKTYDIDYEAEYMDAEETIWYYFDSIKDRWYCISWDDSDSYKKTGAYNGDIVVSVYRGNRKTPYFLKREYPAAFISAATGPVFIKVEGDSGNEDHAGSHSISVEEREKEHYKPDSGWNGTVAADNIFGRPLDIAVFSEEIAEFTIKDHIYITDAETNRVLRFDPDGRITAESEILPGVRAITCSKDGYVFVTDYSSNSVVRLSKDLDLPTDSWGGRGKGKGLFELPAGITVDTTGQYVYVSDSDNHRIQKFDRNGNFILAWGGEGSANGMFRNPAGIVVSPGVTGKYVFVVDTGNNRVQKFEEDGTFVKSWGGGGSENGQFRQPEGIAIDSGWDVYVVDSGNHRIQKFDHIGNYIAQWGTKGTGDSEFNIPNSTAVDSKGNVYVVDTGNKRIQKFKK
jgi:DNA-binding beta-propeller fold protein YncE